MWGNVSCVCVYVYIYIYIVIYRVLTPASHMSQMGIFWCGGTLVLAWVPVSYDGCVGGRVTTITKVAIDHLRPVTRGVVVALL